jgi:hypothetical protein
MSINDLGREQGRRDGYDMVCAAGWGKTSATII